MNRRTPWRLPLARRKLAWITTLLCLAAFFGSWAAIRAASGEPRLSRLFPSGSLLYLQASDFQALLADWNKSPQKLGWVAGSNYEVFSRSRLFQAAVFDGLQSGHVG